MNTRSEASAPVIDEELCERARRVDRWLDAGCSSWGTPTQDIRALTRAALEAGCAGLVAENARLTKLENYARRASIELMNLSGGGSEMFERIGDEFYATPELCRDRAREKLETITRLRSRTALRGDREQGEG